MRRLLVPFLLFLFFPSVLYGQNSGLENVRIEMLNGSSIRGTITAISEDGLVTGEDLPENLTIDQIVEVKTDRKTSAGNGLAKIYLTGGGVLLGGSPKVHDEQFTFENRIGLSDLKLELVKAIVWVDSPRVEEAMGNQSPDNDQVIVQTENGVRAVGGLLEKIDDTHVHLNFKGESRKISLSIVNAVIGANLGLKTAAGTVTQLNLQDGSVLQGRLNSLKGDVLQIELAGRNVINASSSYVVGILVQSDHLVYLSDLEPIEIQERSPFVTQRTWQRNLSVMQNQLTLNFGSLTKQAVFDKGIGVQSYSQLVFKNENDFTRFRATVGIDAETSGRGDCEVSIVGDGVELWSQRVKADSDPLAVSVDITGMENIALVVEPGEQFDLGDHFDWCMARFTKTQ